MALAVIAALVAAGCGSSSSKSSSSASSSSSTSSSGTTASTGSGGTYLGPGATGLGIRPGSGERKEKAEAAGKEAAKQSGATAKLPPVTVGIINFLNGIESSNRLADSTKFAASQLGWKSIVCDGKGEPTQFVACGNSLIAQGVKAIVVVAIEPSQIQAVLAKTKAAHIPVVQVGGGAVPTGEMSGNYGPNEAKAGELATQALFQKLDALPGNPEMAVHNFASLWGSVRTKQLTKAVAAQSKVKITSSVVTDAANLVPFTHTTVTNQITQNPNLKAYWFTFDTTGQVGGGVLAAKYAGKEFPNRPLVLTFHGDHATLALMRKGEIDMVSEVNFDAAVWEGIDGLAQELGRGKPMDKANQATYPVIGDPFTYSIVTKAQLPPEGEYVPPKWDVPSYFIAKWKAEYGV
jgi:ABC-type sugar transport system substrate-binding protein